MKTKIVLDTDIGSDIDDAVCLAYLLARPDCELVGITTVTGEPLTRAKLASALCKAAGKDIPIYPGNADPLQGVQLQPKAPQGAALPKWPHQEEFPQGQAIDFLQETISANPGEITLLAIGPLTNIAELFQRYPDSVQQIKELVLMCGVFFNEPGTFPEGEWNARVDPLATQIVYQAEVPVHKSIGLDVTMKAVLDSTQVRQRFSSGLLLPVRDFAEVWFTNVKNLTFHDPLAAATIFNTQICRFVPGKITSDANDQPGITQFSADEHGQHQVAERVNVERYFEHFFSTMKA